MVVQSPFYNNQPGNKVGLFYNAPEPTWGIYAVSDSD